MVFVKHIDHTQMLGWRRGCKPKKHAVNPRVERLKTKRLKKKWGDILFYSIPVAKLPKANFPI
jgi:hypothetical protein